MDKFVLVVNGQYYYRPFAEFGEFTDDPAVLNNHPEKVALVVFTGGEDVSPSFYGENKGRMTGSCLHRDEFEKKIFDKVLSLKIPMVGICRGSQFLCVMAGGKLCQHIEKHAGYTHPTKLWDGRIVDTNSTHHQMQLPENIPHTLLGWASPRRSTVYLNGDNEQIDVANEYEIVYYKNINALAMQYHPETMPVDSNGAKLCKELTSLLINNELSYFPDGLTTSEKNEK